MPTGYTAKLCEQDQSFEDFMLQCARAFGALIMLRDDPMNKPLPEKVREVSSYYFEDLEKNQKELKEVEAWTTEQAENEASLQYFDELKAYQEHVEKVTRTRIRLVTMLDKVKAWEPPSPEHQGLKDFAIQQLNETIKYDGETYLKTPKKITGNMFKERRISDLKNSITYDENSLKDETQRAEESNTWVDLLRKSL